MDNLNSTLIKKLFYDFQLISNNTVLYISTNNSAMHDILKSTAPNFLRTDLADPIVFNSPIPPFLSILHNSKVKEDEIRNNCYSLQYETMFNYLIKKDSEFDRLDIPVIEEIFYEKCKVKDGIISLLELKKQTSIVISNAQLIDSEAISLLNQIIEEKRKFKIILLFNKEDLFRSLQNEDFNKFYNLIAYGDNFYDIESNIEASENKTYDKQNLFKKNNPNIILKQCRLFFSLSHGLKLAEIFIENQSDFPLDNISLKSMNLEIAILNMYSGRNDEALLFFNAVLENGKYDLIELKALIYLSQLLYHKNDYASSLKYARIAQSKRGENIPQYIQTLADFRVHATSFRINQQYNIELYEILLSKLKSQNLVNNFITASLISWSIDQSDEEKTKVLTYIDNAIETAKQIGNDFALSTSYQWKGIFLSQVKKETNALEYFHKAVEIRDSIGEVLPIIKIRNGLAYNYILKAEYSKAYNIINAMLAKISDIRDYTEIIMTLYNFAMILFYGRNYKISLKIFQSILKIMKIFDMHKLPFQSELDIELIRGITHYFTGDYSQAAIIYERCNTHFDSINSYNKPIVMLLGALLSIHRKEIKNAHNLFLKSIQYVESHCPSQEHYICYSYITFSNELYKNDYKEEAELKWFEGNSYAKNEQIKPYINIFESNNNKTIDSYKIDYQEATLDLEFIETLAKQEKLLNKLHRKIRDIQFINQSMEIGTKHSKKTDYASAVIESIANYMISATIYFVEKKSEEMLLLAENNPLSNKQITSKLWNKAEIECANKRYFYSEAFLDDGTLYGAQLYFNLKSENFTGGILIIMDKENLIETEDIKILDIITQNILSQMVTINQSETLLFLSTTDQMTNLNNRRSLQEKIDKEAELIRRYSKHSRKFMISVAFIDLDNFKYYNDTFGHNAGDYLLKQFAELMLLIFRKVDFISRYGGDEFVVLMPETDTLNATKASIRLQEALKERNYFHNELEVLLKKPINVPKEFYFNFSAGICCNYDLNDMANLDEVMKNADKALYKAKESGKGRTVTYVEIINRE